MKKDGLFVHDMAVCDSDSIGEGTRIWGFSHILKGSVVGKNCNIGEHVFVESQVTIGNGCTIKNGISIWNKITIEDGVFLGPHMVFTNDLRPRAFIKRGIEQYLPTLLKKGCTIGANATLVCGVTIGEYAMIGAGAVVTKDVPAHALAVGVPARVCGRVCYCGGKLDPEDRCLECNKPLSELSIDSFLEPRPRSFSRQTV